MRFLFTGSRDWHDPIPVQFVLDMIVPTGAVIVHGGARGLDRLVDRLATDLARFTIEPHPVSDDEWKRLGLFAGNLRNAHMASLGATLCVAFPLAHSRGTYDCIDQAVKVGIPAMIWTPTGFVARRPA